MNAYIKPALISFALVVVISGLFDLWRTRSDQGQQQAGRIEGMDLMASRGLPEIAGNDIYGQAFSLRSLAGKVVILNFWASWCGPCVEEVPSMLELVAAMKGKVHLVAVSGDSSREDIDAFLKAFPGMKQKDVTIIWDEKQDFARLYAVDRLPESFIAGPDLKLAKKIVGSIRWHSAESEAYLLELSRGQK